MDKPLSTKKWMNGQRPPVKEDAVCAGLYFCAGGQCLAPDAIDGMKYILTEFIPKNLKDIQHVHGCLQYVNSAFDLDPNDRTQVGDNMAIISEAMKVQPPKWLPEHKAATANLFRLLSNAPRAMADPATMLLGVTNASSSSPTTLRLEQLKAYTWYTAPPSSWCT